MIRLKSKRYSKLVPKSSIYPEFTDRSTNKSIGRPTDTSNIWNSLFGAENCPTGRSTRRPIDRFTGTSKTVVSRCSPSHYRKISYFPTPNSIKLIYALLERDLRSIQLLHTKLFSDRSWPLSNLPLKMMFLCNFSRPNFVLIHSILIRFLFVWPIHNL